MSGWKQFNRHGGIIELDYIPRDVVVVTIYTNLPPDRGVAVHVYAARSEHLSLELKLEELLADCKTTEEMQGVVELFCTMEGLS